MSEEIQNQIKLMINAPRIDAVVAVRKKKKGATV